MIDLFSGLKGFLSLPRVPALGVFVAELGQAFKLDLFGADRLLEVGVVQSPRDEMRVHDRPHLRGSDSLPMSRETRGPFGGGGGGRDGGDVGDTRDRRRVGDAVPALLSAAYQCRLRLP